MFSAFSHFISPGESVTRFEVPKLHAVNFVLTKSLGGGGLSSLRLDRDSMVMLHINFDDWSAIF
ncbi:hypothetical protein F5884DRAFT_805066 [Xylogone sp. PMI_703]|nr:hypothetical protein F5884DRAFT_805066 [Xylogone sp. PMI_703]